MSGEEFWAGFTDSSVTLPTPDTEIDREHCCISSFDDPASPGGLYICLKTHRTYGADFLQTSSGRWFLHLTDIWRRSANEEPLKISQSGTAVFSGDTAKFRKIRSAAVYDLTSNTYHKITDDVADKPVSIQSLTEMGIPEIAAKVVQSILSHSNRRLQTWMAAPLQESTCAANLQQCENPPKIPRTDWRCADCGAERNLWMNLSTGFIGCGRKLYGVEQSGCQNGKEGAAVRHFEEDKTGRPLAVKLGTITSSGADVFSYAEDDMVLDTKLTEHLRHFGIDISQMEKTACTMADAELALNKDFDWSCGEGDEPANSSFVKDVGFTGLVNLGNTCYMNVVLQLLGRATQLSQHLLEKDTETSRVIAALLGPRYHRHRRVLDFQLDDDAASFALEHPCVSVNPQRFRNWVSGHSKEFSKSEQQDADEFLRFLMDHTKMPVEFPVEEQLKREDNNAIRAQESEERVITLFVPQPDTETEPEAKRSKVEGLCFAELFERWMNVGNVTRWEKKGEDRVKVSCSLTRRIKKFPAHLFIQVARFYLDYSWKPQKNNVPVHMPDTIDLSEYRATGIPSDACIWKEEEEIDPIVATLIDMGYPEGLSRAAARAIPATVEDRLSGVLDWCGNHKDEAAQHETTTATAGIGVADQGNVEMLMAMGFEELQATVALLLKNADVAAATDWLLSVGVTLQESQLLEMQAKLSAPPSEDDGSGKYRLVGFASHRGKNCHSGHYVCHVRKTNDDWVLINDSRCILVKDAPKDEGYLYLYSREDVQPWESLTEAAAEKLR